MTRGWILLLAAVVPGALTATAAALDLGGNVKLAATHVALPAHSVWRDEAGSAADRVTLQLRNSFRSQSGGWQAQLDTQLIGARGDSPGGTGTDAATGDDRRWFDLTATSSDSANPHATARIDRMTIGFTGQRWSWSIGRQPLSWGNGLYFHPLDFVNPFDPAAVDTEFKPGDEMLSAQYLFDSGADLQLVAVERRNGDGEHVPQVATRALKWSGYSGSTGVDLLGGWHYDEPLLGFGISRSIGGAVWNVDLLAERTGSEWLVRGVTNISYAWTGWGRNMTGGVEYFHSGAGSAARCDLACIDARPALRERLARGELYTVGRDYLAASVVVELTPLLLLTPLAIVNLGDQSALLQLVANFSASQNSRLLVSLQQPVGSRGTEFGGIDASDGRSLATGTALYVQYAYYF